MNDTIVEAFLVRPSGNIGQVVLDPDGKIIAWTTDASVAQVIARLLRENEGLFFTKRKNNNEYKSNCSFSSQWQEHGDCVPSQ